MTSDPGEFSSRSDNHGSESAEQVPSPPAASTVETSANDAASVPQSPASDASHPQPAVGSDQPVEPEGALPHAQSQPMPTAPNVAPPASSSQSEEPAPGDGASCSVSADTQAPSGDQTGNQTSDQASDQTSPPSSASKSDAPAAEPQTPRPEGATDAPSPAASGEQSKTDASGASPSSPPSSSTQPSSRPARTDRPRRRIPIGSQRRNVQATSAPAQPTPTTPIETAEAPPASSAPAARGVSAPTTTPPAPAASPVVPAEPTSEQTPSAAAPNVGGSQPTASTPLPDAGQVSDAALPTAVEQPVPLAAVDEGELEKEVEAALAGASIDELVHSSVTGESQEIRPQSRCKGRVVSVTAEYAFVDLGVRQQGVVPLRQFKQPPDIGAAVDVVVVSFDAEDGLYQLTLPGAAADVGDWSQVAEGMVVEARVTGTNKGGLECQVHSLRGFIPASQVALYRVENLEQFVGQQLPCVVLEVNPRRRKLVLSHRAVLEREKEEARKRLLEELEPGQVREGVVRNIRDFGAFIDLGGVDGLLHVSQMSWSRVKHPKDVLEVGQKIQVKVLKIDPETHKISLGLKDLIANPWSDAAEKYAPKTVVEGKVTKITDFGAFVELEPGVEGMIHISELAHRRVGTVREVLSEGQEVRAQVLSVDPQKRRIALSLKALEAKPEEPQKPQPKAPPKKRRHDPSLKGGVGGATGGEKFGLKW